jgi:hypothetical protein
MSRIRRNDLSFSEVNDALLYGPETGLFRWRDTPDNGRKAGRQVGTVCNTGHVMIRIGGTVRLAHRLAWLLHHKEMPPDCIDHINGQRADNRIENLRVVTPAGNAQNSAKHRRGGLVGVSYWTERKTFRADICVRRKRIYLGSFDTEEAAHAAYLAAKAVMHEAPRTAAR